MCVCMCVSVCVCVLKSLYVSACVENSAIFSQSGWFFWHTDLDNDFVL